MWRSYDGDIHLSAAGTDKTQIKNLNQTGQMITEQEPQDYPINFNDQQTRQVALQFELKMLQIYGPTLNIYVLPHVDSPNIWNGIIFVRHGYYKEGKFRFNIDMQPFPQNQPKMYFQTKMFHPLVNFQTGQLDVKSLLFGDWDYSSGNMFYSLMNELNLLFTDKEKINNKLSYNPQAAYLYEKNIRQFILMGMKCVDESKQKLHQCWADSSLNTQEILNQQKQQLKRLLDETCSSNMNRDQKTDYFLKQILDQ